METLKERKYALKGHGTMLLVLAFLAAILYYFAHPMMLSRSYAGLPGIGWAVSQWVLLGGGLIASFMEDKKRFLGNFAGYFLLVCALLLGACYAIFGNRAMRLMNAPILMLTSAQAIFAFSGHHGENPLSHRGWIIALGRIFTLPFQYFIRPFEAMAEGRKGKEKRIKGLGTGLLIGVPVLIVALILLASADSMFGDLFSRIFDALAYLDAAFVLRLSLALLLGLLLFSFLFGATMTRKQEKEWRTLQVPPATFGVALAGMAVLYALFAYIQFRYLFLGVEAAAMKGGYAEYARGGFFQLILLAFITLGILLPGLCLCRESSAVRVLGALVALLTIIIDFSAAFRMQLYIQAYGLTVLRLVTLWGMLAVLIALLLAAVKCIRPSFKMFPWLSAALLISWIGLNFINIDARIAEYNVKAWEKGEIVRLDTEYLVGLSPDVLPALEKIQDSEKRDDFLREVTEAFRAKYPVDYDWSFSWRHLPEMPPQPNLLPVTDEQI